MSIICNNPDCKVSETGNCMDGFSPVSTCPNIDDELPETKASTDNQEAETVQHFEVSTKEKSKDNKRVTVDSGTTLDFEESSKVIRKSGSKVIACVGPNGVGKTTLLASMYEYINKNSLPAYPFAASKTLFSFEEICHLARATSGRDKADTPRTPTTGKASFYHLAFNIKGAREDLLFADRAGEEYAAILVDSDECKNLTEIKRCDVFLLLVDAEKLSNISKHLTTRKIIKSIQILHEEKMIADGVKLIIVMTCYDKTTPENRYAVDKTLSAIQEKISNILSDITVSIEQHTVAARPDNSEEFNAGHGVKELLIKLIELPIVTNLQKPSVQSLPKSSRIFHKLKDEV
jgi:GTPase SAR1 family protein